MNDETEAAPTQHAPDAELAWSQPDLWHDQPQRRRSRSRALTIGLGAAVVSTAAAAIWLTGQFFHEETSHTAPAASTSTTAPAPARHEHRGKKPPPAPSDGYPLTYEDQKFVSLLGALGFTYPSPHYAVQRAQAICEFVQGHPGIDALDIADYSAQITGWKGITAAQFADLAQAAYCPSGTTANP